ncbi:MAG: hypothetical protein EB021_09010 [Gammaproteobacteria bacterium]|nr:hypothetical protein [Gammaproteobacteria bacterium]NDB25563.1 hypothetical protein [Gammaproteobacteria bacterium]
MAVGAISRALGRSCAHNATLNPGGTRSCSEIRLALGGSTPSSRIMRQSMVRSEIAIPPMKNSQTKPATATVARPKAEYNTTRTQRGQRLELMTDLSRY